MRLLVVKTSSLGDVVHACAAITDLKRARPDVQVDWLVESSCAAIPRMHAGVDAVVPMSWRRWRKQLLRADTRTAMVALQRQLRDAHYDLVIDLQGLVKSAWWASRAKAPVCGYDRASLREPLARWWYQRTAKVPVDQQAVARCRQLMAAHLQYALPTTPPDFGLRAPAPGWSVPAPYAVVMPAASRIEKRWPEADWRATLAHLHAARVQPVILWGAPDEEALAQRLAAGTTAVVPPFLSIADAAGVLQGARIVVGLDTGFTHLGAALGRPTVGIYCDHSPGLAGITGSGPVYSLGDKGAPPPLGAVLQAVDAAMVLPAAPRPRR